MLGDAAKLVLIMYIVDIRPTFDNLQYGTAVLLFKNLTCFQMQVVSFFPL